MPIDAGWLASRLMMLIPLWLSLSVHEWAHAWMAWRLGDDTAARMGRLTLNPLAHIDPIGTLLLPLLGIPFGWARPVPVQPNRFHPRISMRIGMMLTAIAGPLANVGLTMACMLVIVALVRLPTTVFPPNEAVALLLQRMILLNVILAFFNALPIPPLDGSRVVDALVPEPLRPVWEGFCRLGPVALIAVIVLPRYIGFNLFQWPQEAVLFVLRKLVGQ